ncbi:MAG: hypothetical protein IKD07_02040, partial [Clostridia bacterium]|nr:hypothetical protein [Clostridia bacterium]
MKNVKKKKLYIVLLLSMLLIGGLAIYAGYTYIKNEDKVLFENTLRTDYATMVAVFLIVLPLLLAVLAACAVFLKKAKRTAAVRIAVPADSPKKQKPAQETPTGERFCMLSDIDRNSGKYGRMFYEKGVTLESFCNDFRSYAANKLKLYYDIEDIRRFVAGLAVSKLVILQGMSGTGKTSLAHAFGSFTDNSSTVIPVQPMWKERTDLIGYYNEFTKRFNETLLLEKMYEANYSEDMYIT